MSSKMKRFIGWTVWLDDKCIDTVFYDSNCDAEYVRSTLVNHDGYDSRIKIRIKL